MKVLSLEEIAIGDRAFELSMGKVEDDVALLFKRLLHTAREYHRLREALEFYADETKWEGEKVDDSYGGWITGFYWKQKDADNPEDKAREALTGSEGS